ncbi:Conserved putative membrane protein [Estrella lausannensis]|uniref:Conserved putative membrane protein n=2 Tax=Estrella lausannensis TaxID=483423 RepID=A0A0H5DQ13_9BACT|nr:Conserved putative membrane protein [Estrella lausannensis]
MVIGEDVNKVWRLGCGDRDNEKLEAVVRDIDFKKVMLFEIWNEGYISLDDWGDLDAKNLLESLSERAEAANRELGRTRVGRELHVIGWMQEPVFDKHTNTVYWSIEFESSEEGAVVLSVAIRLGRESFVKLICIASKESYASGDGHFDAMLRSHSFDPGYRHQDYRTGDRIASYGVASLVAASVVGEMANATGATGILKILGAFIFAGIAAVLYKLKNIFKRRGEE